MSDERPFHERDLYRRYVDRGIAIDAALAWFKGNDWRDVHALECAQLDWYDSDAEFRPPSAPSLCPSGATLGSAISAAPLGYLEAD